MRYSYGWRVTPTSSMAKRFSAAVSVMMLSSKDTATFPSSGSASPNVRAQCSTARLMPASDTSNACSCLATLRMSALLSLDSPAQQISIFREIQKNGYSVRKVEEIVKRLKNGEEVQMGKKKIVGKSQLPENYDAMRSRLSDVLQTRVEMSCTTKGSGKISIPFDNEADLQRILNTLDMLKNHQ